MALCINIYQIFVKFVHIIALSQYIFSIIYDLNNVIAPATIPFGGFGGRSRYLTYWCLVCKHNKIDKMLFKINKIQVKQTSNNNEIAILSGFCFK